MSLKASDNLAGSQNLIDRVSFRFHLCLEVIIKNVPARDSWGKVVSHKAEKQYVGTPNAEQEAPFTAEGSRSPRVSGRLLEEVYRQNSTATSTSLTGGLCWGQLDSDPRLLRGPLPLAALDLRQSGGTWEFCYLSHGCLLRSLSLTCCNHPLSTPLLPNQSMFSFFVYRGCSYFRSLNLAFCSK